MDGVWFILAASGILAVFVLHPVMLLAAWAVHSPRAAPQPLHESLPPTVSLITTVCGGGDLLARKVANSLAIDYAPERMDIIVVSDGRNPHARSVASAQGDRRLRYLETDTSGGKNAALRLAAARALGDVLVFSDVDAILAPDAVCRLVERLADPAVGGVCGQRVIAERASGFQAGQEMYLTMDSALRVLESRVGSLTTNDGKIHAVRRSLYQPAPDGVADDLFQCVAVVCQRRRFVFEPSARAFVQRPSRSPGHELYRRRRIVCRNLTGLWRQRAVFNPLRFGWYSVRIAIDKVLRRLLPVCLMVCLVTSAQLSTGGGPFAFLLTGQLAFYGLAFAGAWFHERSGPLRGLRRAAAVAHYFVIGNIGNALGIWDFLVGERYVAWSPQKADLAEPTAAAGKSRT